MEWLYLGCIDEKKPHKSFAKCSGIAKKRPEKISMVAKKTQSFGNRNESK
jgi:hypothetical protein